MPASIVQGPAITETNNTTGDATVTLPGAVTPGNLLVIGLGVRSDAGGDPTSVTPLTWVYDGVATFGGGFGNGGAVHLFHRVVQVADPLAFTTHGRADYKRAWIAEFGLGGPLGSVATAAFGGASGPPFPSLPGVLAAAGLVIDMEIHGDPDNATAWVEDAAGWTTLSNGNNVGLDPKQIASYKVGPAGSYVHTPTGPGGSVYAGRIVAFSTPAAAGFAGEPGGGLW